MVQRLFKFGGEESEQVVDRRFLAFEDKTIDEQADEVTRQLIYDEEAPIFDFDAEDREVKKEFQKHGVVAGVTITGLSIADINVLNRTKWGLALGPLRKFALINVINLPVYWYFATTLKSAHMDLKKHIVQKYLIQGGEILYKRRQSSDSQ